MNQTECKYKQCGKCKSDKLHNDFDKCSRSADGLQLWCRNCRKEWHKEYYTKNKERIYQREREWAKNNPDKIKEYLNRSDVIIKRRKWKRDWDRKYLMNPVNRMDRNIRTTMCHALKGKKGFRKWEDLVGYTIEDLTRHISSLLIDGMTWDNYGDVWHIDHITPKSWFNYNNAEDSQFKECWALSNLKPMLKIDNIKKGNRRRG